jgi:ubiquinone/menaquinone biosynthesis C-methylase UbiE
MTANPLSQHARTHLEKIRADYEKGLQLTKPALSFRDMLAAYYNLLIPASASVLEVGCGAGDLLSRLRVRVRTGIDLAAGQIRLAQEKVPDGDFFVQAGEELDLPGKCFDYIVVSETANLAADV